MLNSLCLNCKWRNIDCSGTDDDNLEPGIDYKNYDCYKPDDSEEDNFDPSEEYDY